MKAKVFLTAFEIVKDPAKWTQGAYARDINGESCMAHNPQAVCWCSLGALRKVAGEDYGFSLAIVQGALLLDGINIIDVNDKETHADVIAAWEEVGKRKGWIS